MNAKLKNAWTGFVAGAKAQYPWRNSNLKCSYIEGDFEDKSTLPFILPVRNYIQNHKFSDAAVMIDSYIGQRIFTSTGRPLYSIAASELANEFGDENSDIEKNEQLLGAYADWFGSRPECPYAASSYASALQTTGHSHRGTSVAQKVKPHQWEAMQSYNAKAQKIYETTRSQFYNHWYWSKNYLRFALTSGVEKPEIWRRFNQCITNNPYDYKIYDIMAYMMLPRWHGSVQDVEKVAQLAVNATYEHFGDMMYARTFVSIFDYRYLYGLEFDWAKLKKGFIDWFNFFPSDYVKTYYACAVYTMGEYPLALDILESLDDFYIEAWDAKEDIYLANSICREFAKNKPASSE